MHPNPDFADVIGMEPIYLDVEYPCLEILAELDRGVVADISRESVADLDRAGTQVDDRAFVVIVIARPTHIGYVRLEYSANLVQAGCRAIA